MGKKKVAVIVLIIFLISLFNFYFFKKIPNTLANSIINFQSNALQEKLLISIFLSQGPLIILGGIIFLVKKFKKKKIKKEDQKKIVSQRYAGKEVKTEIDSFYELLKVKKSLKLSSVAKKFNLKKGGALEWGKILENHKLALIEYPAFGDPIIKIYEKETKEIPEKGKKTNEEELEKNTSAKKKSRK